MTTTECSRIKLQGERGKRAYQVKAEPGPKDQSSGGAFAFQAASTHFAPLYCNPINSAEKSSKYVLSEQVSCLLLYAMLE